MLCCLGTPLFGPATQGILLLQLAVPELRTAGAFRLFNQELRQYDCDLDKWRQYKVRGVRGLACMHACMCAHVGPRRHTHGRAAAS